MKIRSAGIIALWLAIMAAAVIIVARAHYITDLSAFLPSKPTPLQKLLVDQLRDGPASRLILIALEGTDATVRARTSAEMARLLRSRPEFSSVENGEPLLAEHTEDVVFQHRYLLSDAVTPQHFSSAGLRDAIKATVEDLASSSGLMLKSLVERDPTGETLQIIDRLGRMPSPHALDGVWASADGSRTLLAVQTTAAGSDTDAQERDLALIVSAFATGQKAARAQPSQVRLRMSGPGVFAVAARSQIKRAATHLSIVSSLLVIGVLLAVYRSVTALVLGLLPVASGALLGIAAVAVGFGAVHGITLGFGITLIGESVDYSIYFFVQSRRGYTRLLWPTIRLGMMTSICGFASLLPSGFPGLAQLGLYSISGLIGAGLVTRFVLPELIPAQFRIRDVTPLGAWLGRRRDVVRGLGQWTVLGTAVALATVALCVLYLHRGTLWNRELSQLSPIPLQDQQYDATLRADLGAADVLDIVVVGGASLEAALQGAEHAGAVLQRMADSGFLDDFDSPTDYLPSAATQALRRNALPDRGTLERRLPAAVAGLGLKDERLLPFLDDVEAARRGPLLTTTDLRATSLATGFGALILHQADRWSALLPLHGLKGPGGPLLNVSHIDAAFAGAHLHDTQVLDLKAQTDALYADYLSEAIRLSLYGLALIVLLLAFALRSTRRAARVLAPLILAVLTVASALVLLGQQLTILHLVGMLLIVAVGSNYALFFDDESIGPKEDSAALTLASLGIANLSTVIGFGLLSFSRVPVLEALGQTVAPGAFLALVFSALMTSRAPPADWTDA